MITDKYNAKTERKSLHMLEKMFIETLLDGNFQRYGGVDRGSGWNIKNGKSYISNFLQGATFNSIINVDIEAALRYCNEIRDLKSITYFNDVLKRGYKFVSIDGNNSASYLIQFISCNEKIQINHISYSKPTSFKNLTESEQDDIRYTEKINVVILRNITVDQMCDLFRFLNTSTKLNGQEWRQARISGLAQAIRDYGDSQRPFFTHFLFPNPLELDKRAHEELIAVMALKIHIDFQSAANAKSLNHFYENTEDLHKTTISALDKIFNVCDRLAETLSIPLQKKLAKGQVQNLFDFIYIVTVVQGFSICDTTKFLEWFMERDTEFRAASSSVTEKNREKKSYVYWTKFYQNKNNYENIRKLYMSVFATDIEKLVSREVLKYNRTNKDNFLFEDKLKLYRLQHRETRQGDKIKALDLYLGKYEVDHVTSVKDGGKTEISNAELMKTSENRSKGAKSNEPFFPHQELVCQ